VGKNRTAQLINSFGPGLLYAGAAIGVSHLVQSTRAGASFGWWPVLAIVFIHLAKYPFFKAGPAYAMATGESLIQGYFRQGKGYGWLFLLFTLGTMFAIIAAIVAVTSGVMAYYFKIDLPPNAVAAIVLFLSVALLLAGNYKWLDRIIKFIILMLTVCTVTALVSALVNSPDHSQTSVSQILEGTFLIMMVKLMGWMPAPLDLSVWNSLWVIEKKKQNEELSIKECMRDFNFGYWGTMVMGVFFLGLGALSFYGSDGDLPSSGVGFANALIGMYTDQLGSWAFYIVGFAAVATMVSTTLTCIDAIPRSLAEWMKIATDRPQKHTYTFSLILLAAGSFSLLTLLSTSMTVMVDIATVISFCSAPIIAWMNFKVMRGKEVIAERRPSPQSTIWEIVSIALLTLLTLAFLIYS
jgi:Mn2+/Fe2+ NRAMP family transporter